MRNKRCQWAGQNNPPAFSSQKIFPYTASFHKFEKLFNVFNEIKKSKNINDRSIASDGFRIDGLQIPWQQI